MGETIWPETNQVSWCDGSFLAQDDLSNRCPHTHPPTKLGSGGRKPSQLDGFCINCLFSREISCANLMYYNFDLFCHHRVHVIKSLIKYDGSLAD